MLSQSSAHCLPSARSFGLSATREAENPSEQFPLALYRCQRTRCVGPSSVPHRCPDLRQSGLVNVLAANALFLQCKYQDTSVAFLTLLQTLRHRTQSQKPSSGIIHIPVGITGRPQTSQICASLVLIIVSSMSQAPFGCASLEDGMRRGITQRIPVFHGSDHVR